MTETLSLLTPELLERIRINAAEHDRNNTFPIEDFRELVAVGYLRMFVPTDRGGLGFGLERVTQEQARLAAASAPLALAVNMHLVWTGVAKTLLDRGDDSLAFVLDEAGQGEVFAFGVSEAGNDLVLFGSTTRAQAQDDGSYRYYGTKIFTSLSPVWTRLGVFGLDAEAEDGGRLVWGFLRRDAEGITALDDWDVLGMRASQSTSTVLDGARVPADRIVRKLPPGPQPDLLIFGIFANFEILLSSVYAGLGQRALELAVEAAHRRTSMKDQGRPLAYDPDIRWRVADAAIAHDGLAPQISVLARAVDDKADLGAAWFPRLAGVKIRVTETARQVVDQALRVAGGSAYSNSNELNRLYRDVLAGIFHPSDAESAHNTVANAWLGPVPS